MNEPISGDPATGPQQGGACLAVVHETAYRYDARVEVSHHLTHLRPRHDARQSLDAHVLHIEPAPARVHGMPDTFGNWRSTFALYVPHDALLVRASSRVTVHADAPALQSLPAMPWEQAAERLRYAAGRRYAPECEFALPSPYVPLHAELRAYALRAFTPGRPVPEAALALMQRIHADFDYAADSTHVATPLVEAFRQRQGVCQDFAHVMIGCLRALGLAARYVSGYLLSHPPPGQPRLVGADASHAWVSVHCPDAMSGAWLDLDPTNAMLPGREHAVLAYGRDYGDVTPLRGVIRGGGGHALEVRVTVAPWQEAPAGLSLPPQQETP
ncbi:transglutaminase family protein [Bordetella sp. 2513F-2]